MAYTIEKLSTAHGWVATMELTIPDFSRSFDVRLMQTMRNELDRIGCKLSNPEYNYMIAYDSDDRVELVDIKIFVSVEAPVEADTAIEFIQLEGEEEIVRVTADTFEDVHIGIAEWMHDNDYIAADDMRRVLVKDDNVHVYDSPVKPSDE